MNNVVDGKIKSKIRGIGGLENERGFQKERTSDERPK